MRILLIALTLISLSFMTPGHSMKLSRGPFKSCSCSADDGSCSMSGYCPQGCLALCPSGTCRIICVDEYEGMLDMSASITLQLKNASSDKVAAELGRLTGAPVMFNTRQSRETFNLDVKDKPLWNVLEELSSRGKIQIAKEDFGHLRKMRESLLSGERIAACFTNVTAKRLATELSFLSGRDVYVASGDPDLAVNYTGKEVTFEEIVTGVSQEAGVVIAIR